MIDETKEPQAPIGETAPSPDSPAHDSGEAPPASGSPPANGYSTEEQFTDPYGLSEDPYGGEPYISEAPDPYAFHEDPYRGEPYRSPEPESQGVSEAEGEQTVAHEWEEVSEAPENVYNSQMAPFEPPTVTLTPEPEKTAVQVIQPPPPPPPPPDEEDEEDEEEGGMLRMSFMDHLEELRMRILRCLIGVGVAFILSLSFTDRLWSIVEAPAITALKHLHFAPKLVVISPMEGFSIIYVKMPLLVSVFIAAPWVLYQVWAFISPGLYKRERRFAVPFILTTAGLFITGGLFAYFVAFRYGLEFLLGIGRDVNVAPMVSIDEYFDLFVNVTLGIAVVFELPVVIFFLTLLRIVSPRFMMRNSRYAVLAIVVLAAIVTPTPDVFNLMLFAVPMCMLFFVGVFAGHLLVLKREGRRFPWTKVFLVLLGAILIAAGFVYLAVVHYHYHFIQHWPYLMK
jgi:sec-independent protein translocase protein TatC